MTPQERKVMEQALEALKTCTYTWKECFVFSIEKVEEAVIAVEKALAQPEQICGFDVVIDELMPPNTFKLAQPEQEPVAWLTDDERKAFERFNETCEDGEGYDVPKTMMRRLAEIGVIHHTSRGIYGITKFGRSLVGYIAPPQRKPLTDDQIKKAWYDCGLGRQWDVEPDCDHYIFARAIEAAHNIKENT